jgi:hypothetical protein
MTSASSSEIPVCLIEGAKALREVLDAIPAETPGFRCRDGRDQSRELNYRHNSILALIRLNAEGMT